MLDLHTIYFSVLAYFPYFEIIKAVCVSVPPFTPEIRNSGARKDGRYNKLM
jgi:hypothetical protein